MTRTRKVERFLAIVLCAVVCGAWIPSAGADGTTPAHSSRGRMPGTMTLGSLASEYEAVTFDHAAHVEEAGGCGECHHRHEPETAVGCRECHAIDPPASGKAVRAARVRPCGKCHPAVLSRTDLSRPALKAAYHRACFRCHREVGSVGEDPKGCTEMCHERNRIREVSHEKHLDWSSATGAR